MAAARLRPEVYLSCICLALTHLETTASYGGKLALVKYRNLFGKHIFVQGLGGNMDFLW